MSGKTLVLGETAGVCVYFFYVESWVETFHLGVNE